LCSPALRLQCPIGKCVAQLPVWRGDCFQINIGSNILHAAHHIAEVIDAAEFSVPDIPDAAVAAEAQICAMLLGKSLGVGLLTSQHTGRAGRVRNEDASQGLVALHRKKVVRSIYACTTGQIQYRDFAFQRTQGCGEFLARLSHFDVIRRIGVKQNIRFAASEELKVRERATFIDSFPKGVSSFADASRPTPAAARADRQQFLFTPDHSGGPSRHSQGRFLGFNEHNFGRGSLSSSPAFGGKYTCWQSPKGHKYLALGLPSTISG